MAFQKHSIVPAQYGNKINYEHHNPNSSSGPLTEIAKDVAKKKLGDGADSAWKKLKKGMTKTEIDASTITPEKVIPDSNSFIPNSSYEVSSLNPNDPLLSHSGSAAEQQSILNQYRSPLNSVSSSFTANAAPSALQTAALQTAASAAPAGLGIAPGAAAAITGSVGTGAALAGAAAPAMTAGAVGAASTGMAAAAPALAALGPLGLLIGGGLLASQLGKSSGDVEHLYNNGGRIGMNTGMSVNGRDEVDAARIAELERLRQAWLNKNNQGVTESLIPEARPYQSAMPVTKDWLSNLWAGTQGQSWDFPTERIDDVRFKGGPPDMIGPLSPYSNEDARSQLEDALKQSESDSEQRRKDALNDAKIAKIQGETKKRPMNFSGTTSHIDGSNENIRIPDALVAEAQGYGVNTMGHGVDVSGMPKASYGGGWPPAWSGTPSYLAGDRQTFQGMAHEPWIDPAENPDNSYAPNRSIVPIARPMMNMSEADVEAGSVVQGAPLGMGRDEVEARRQFKLEELRKESLGLNDGGPLGRSQMMTPQAITHAASYDAWRRANMKYQSDAQLKRYWAKNMIRSFPGEAPLTIRERIVDPILARTPIHRVTDYGKIKLDN
tara:strand:- start:11756 stop:13579 length:1824 start_codon:yes stop_codon:yes gene_type:complete